MEKKTNKVLLIICIVLGILAVGFGGYFVYDKYFSDNDVENKDDKGNDDNKENLKGDNNEENNNNFDTTLMNTEDRKLLSEELVSTGVLEKALSLDELKNDFLGTYIDAKIDDNGYFSITYDGKTEKYDYLGKIKDVYSFYNQSAIPNMLFVATNNELYYGIPYEYQVNKLENKSGKIVISSYIDNNTGGEYLLFDDYSLVNLTYDYELNKYILKNDILNNNFVLDGLFIYGQCGGYCPPTDVIVSFDGILKIKDNNDKYVELKYNNKTMNFKYGYYIYNKEYSNANIYLIDNDNNVYVINNYTESNRNTKLEKLSYKFDSLSTNETYNIKYSNNSTVKVGQFDFIDLTKYFKLFNLYNKYN